MCKVDKIELREILDAHKLWLEGKGGKRADLNHSDLSDVCLKGVNLKGADLQRANLSSVNLDFSSWPLWCGGLHVKTDRRLMAQLAYHFCCQDCDDPDYIKARDAILWFANSFHRADECGKLEPLEKDRA